MNWLVSIRRNSFFVFSRTNDTPSNNNLYMLNPFWTRWTSCRTSQKRNKRDYPVTHASRLLACSPSHSTYASCWAKIPVSIPLSSSFCTTKNSELFVLIYSSSLFVVTQVWLSVYPCLCFTCNCHEHSECWNNPSIGLTWYMDWQSNFHLHCVHCVHCVHGISICTTFPLSFRFDLVHRFL